MDNICGDTLLRNYPTCIKKRNKYLDDWGGVADGGGGGVADRAEPAQSAAVPPMGIRSSYITFPQSLR